MGETNTCRRSNRRRFRTAMGLGFLLCTQLLTAQTLPKNDEAKFNADYYLMRGDFEKALELYTGILISEPDNADIKHRIGICYLNSDDRKEEAIPYLEEATQKVSERYDDKSFRETNAPVESFFLLGSAYRVNNQLEEAISAYRKYQEYLDPKDKYQQDVTAQYIASCLTAQQMLTRRRRAQYTNLGSRINTGKPEYNAVVSGDGKTLVFTTPGRQGYEIWTSVRTDSIWQQAKNITPSLGGLKYLKSTGISGDGTTLLLVLEDPENSEIYISRLKKGRWSKAELMPKPVSSKYNETHASLSPDGRTVFFTSNRKGGLGDLDIYRCDMTNDKWGEARNLGPLVNTAYNEETPFMTGDGKALYFSSEGHQGMGGFDIFRVVLDDPGAKAINLGYPVNTTDNNLFFQPFGDGSSAYLSRWDKEGLGGRDIYYVITEIPEPEPEPVPDVPVVADDTVGVQPALMADREPVTGPELPGAMEEEDPPPVGVEIAPAPAPVPVRDVPAVFMTDEEPDPVQDLPEPVAIPEETEKYVETGPAVAIARSWEVQFMALRKPVDIQYFKGIDDIVMSYRPDAWFRYTCLITADSMKAVTLRAALVRKGYGDAFIRRKAILPHFTVQVMAVPGPVTDLTVFGNLDDISASRWKDHYCRYTTGAFETRDEAQEALVRIRSMGYPRAFIRKVRIQ